MVISIRKDDQGSIEQRYQKTNRNPGQIERAYGYYDIPQTKTRVFVLNSIDVPTRLDEDTNKLYYNGQGTTDSARSSCSLSQTICGLMRKDGR